MPEGVYRIAFAAPDGNYEPAFLDTVRAVSGAARELPLVELSWSRFQPPPPPAGLSAIADSASGTIRIAWRPVKLANLAYYEVARIDSADSANNALFRTADTSYTDTVSALPASRALAYRITTVNALGNRSSAGPAQTRPAVVPAHAGYRSGNGIPGRSGAVGVRAHGRHEGDAVCGTRRRRLAGFRAPARAAAGQRDNGRGRTVPVSRTGKRGKICRNRHVGFG